MKTYADKKEAARNEAIAWQAKAVNENYSYGEMTYYAAHFEALGRRYGLLCEFHANGIC